MVQSEHWIGKHKKKTEILKDEYIPVHARRRAGEREKKEWMLVRQTVFKYYIKNRGRKTAQTKTDIVESTLKFSDRTAFDKVATVQLIVSFWHKICVEVMTETEHNRPFRSWRNCNRYKNLAEPFLNRLYLSKTFLGIFHEFDPVRFPPIMNAPGKLYEMTCIQR